MDVALAILYLVGGLFGMMLGFYLVLCFIQWISDVVDEKRWRYWL
jgi:predicted PurR-regulated permease PerM